MCKSLRISIKCPVSLPKNAVNIGKDLHEKIGSVFLKIFLNYLLTRPSSATIMAFVSLAGGHEAHNTSAVSFAP